MAKPTAVLEITNSEIRMISGYIVDGKPAIIYSRSIPSKPYVSNGELNDYSAITNAISSFKKIVDVEAKLRFSVNEVTLVLPPNGFEIFQTDKTTNVVSTSSIIQNLDIQNAISLVQKENVPNGSEIVEIVPAAFLLEGNRVYGTPPLGEKSSSIAIRAYVHTLPSRLISDYSRVVESSDIRVKRCVVSSYAISEAIRHKKDSPKNYILIDMGEGITTFTLVANHFPINSTYCIGGAINLKERLMNSFHIDENKATELIEKYGISFKETEFYPNIILTDTPDGGKFAYSERDLNNLIEEFLQDYFKLFDTAFNSLLKDVSAEAKRLPIILTGGFSKLNGLDVLIKNKYILNQSVDFYIPDCIGLRNPSYSAMIGALYLSNEYRGSLTDQRAVVSQVSRDKESKNK